MTPDQKELSRCKGIQANIDQKCLMSQLTDDFARLAHEIIMKVPNCADRSSAIRYLRLSLMQINAAICHDWPEEKNDNK